MSSRKKKPTKETLKELCTAHSQLVQTKDKHAQTSDVSQILMEMFDQKILELQHKITSDLKAWLGE